MMMQENVEQPAHLLTLLMIPPINVLKHVQLVLIIMVITKYVWIVVPVEHIEIIQHVYV